MLRVCTSLCLVAGVTSAAAFADQPIDYLLDREGRPIRDVIVTGCVGPGSQPDVYTLAVASANDPPQTGAVLTAGTPLRLTGLPPGDFQEYLGQQVEVFGMLRPQRLSRGRGRSTTSNDPSKVIVRSIRQLAVTCSAPAPVATASAPAAAPAAANRGSRGRLGDRAAAMPPPPPAGVPPTAAAPPTGAARPPARTTPGWPAGSPSAPGAGSPTTPTGSAPANTTSTNAASGQSGISGSATLGGTIAMTPPVITFPIGRPPAPTSGAPQPASSLPASGLAQGATNATTSNAALDQFGVTGDAMLSGLVNVNIQQLLASVQVIANVNVQDVVVNLSDILNDTQIQALVQALNTNPQAALNANDLTSALQQAGVLDPSQWVVGVTGSQLYENRNLSSALQQRGIIQPGETIMGTSTPHVYVMGNK